MATIEAIKDLATLSQGRVPVWTSQTVVDPGALNGPPTSTLSGLDMGDAVIAYCAVSLRSAVTVQTARVTIDAVDDTATYTITLDGVNADYAAMGGDLEAEIAAGLKAAVEALPAGYTVALDGSDLIITGPDIDQYTVAVSATGTGALSEWHDASFVRFRIWVLSKTLGTWHKAVNLDEPTDSWNQTQVNWMGRFLVAGMSRAYIEILETDGRVTPRLGPTRAEV
jgi:hypothetical protein